MDAVDLHQHLWPASFVELLRRRTHAPYLRDWQLVSDGEPPYEIRPQDHEVGSRIAQDHRAGIGIACVCPRWRWGWAVAAGRCAWRVGGIP